LGCGWVVWRERSDLPEDLIFNVNYLGGNMPTFALNFSRPGGQIVAQYYNFVRLGREGYTKVHTACYQTAQYLAKEIAALGPFEMIFSGDPADGIPAFAGRFQEGANPGYTLYDLADRLCFAGLAGAGLFHAGQPARPRRPANHCSPGSQPRSGLPAAGQLQGCH
jgi:glutamate decarboxylase